MEQILIALLTLIITVATYIFKKFVVPYINSKVKRENWDMIISLVKIAVTAAEQIFKESDAGRNKKEYVQKYLAQMSIKLTDQELDTIIESAVYQLNNAKLELVESTTNI